MEKIKTPKAVTIATLTLVTIVLWIIFGIVNIVIKTDEPNVPPEISEPLTPALDTSVLTKLDSRVFLRDDQIGQTQLTASETPLPTLPPHEGPTQTPITTPSPIPTATP